MKKPLIQNQSQLQKKSNDCYTNLQSFYLRSTFSHRQHQKSKPSSFIAKQSLQPFQIDILSSIHLFPQILHGNSHAFQQKGLHIETNIDSSPHAYQFNIIDQMQKKHSSANKGDNYVPFYQKRGKRKRLFSDPTNSRSGVNHFSWNIDENFLYVGYIKAMQDVMTSVASRKEVQIYKRMSKLIRTRSIDQIKSHHQKMMIKHESLENIITSLQIYPQNTAQPSSTTSIEELQVRLAKFLEQEIPYVQEIMDAKSQRDKRKGKKDLSHDPSRIATIGEAQVKIEQASDFFYITEG